MLGDDVPIVLPDAPDTATPSANTVGREQVHQSRELPRPRPFSPATCIHTRYSGRIRAVSVVMVFAWREVFAEALAIGTAARSRRARRIDLRALNDG